MREKEIFFGQIFFYGYLLLYYLYIFSVLSDLSWKMTNDDEKRKKKSEVSEPQETCHNWVVSTFLKREHTQQTCIKNIIQAGASRIYVDYSCV